MRAKQYPILKTGEICEREVSDTIRVELWYPQVREEKFVTIDLIDVRANDGIRIHYDFDRDGWVIEQPTKLAWGVDEEPNPHWKKVAFIQAWALMEDGEEKNNK